MPYGKRLAGLLLLTTSLTLPSVLHAQDAPPEEPVPAEDSAEPLTDAADGEAPAEDLQGADISLPGGDIIVTGRRQRNPARTSGQVLNVLSEADIARSGEGDIAGALARVSGLSLVGSGRVFVRGLGDRYSLALLNGLPLPSPEPLSRVVPLDIFPTSVIASSIVQKTYSANFPGEFGGGVQKSFEQALEALKAGAGADVDLLIGSNAEEMNLYLVPSGVRDRIGRLLAWLVLNGGWHRWMRLGE